MMEILAIGVATVVTALGVLGFVLAQRMLRKREGMTLVFRPLSERDTTFRPVSVGERSVPGAPMASTATRPPCWICGRPKDGHRHE